MIRRDMKPLNISNKAARRVAITAQLLNGASSLPSGKEGIARLIEHLGYVQVDTIAVIERAHNHTIWTRCKDFHADMLHDLQAVDRRIFEYWGHAHSYLPMNDYRFYLPRMKAFNDPKDKWVKERFVKFKHLLAPVKERIAKEGPLSSRDFQSDKPRQGTWWDWGPAKIALELLFWLGELMITERRNFQRIYDLTERVLPPGTDTTYPSDTELGRFLVHRALNAYGLASPAEIAEHIHSGRKKIIPPALEAMVEDGQVCEVIVDKKTARPYYALTDAFGKLQRGRRKLDRMHILSPFDNLVIQRGRLSSLFDFDYTIECFVPAPKRKYGYFVLPILWGDRFIGRLDPKVDRKKRVLYIRKIFIEDQKSDPDAFLPQLANAVAAFARFNDCTTVTVEKASPAKMKTLLARHIKNAMNE